MKRKLCGIFICKERWGLSWRGRLAALALIVFVVWGIVLQIHPFLAVTHRQDSKILVVEGWVHQYAINAAVKEFRTGQYDHVFVTGGPVPGSGGYSNDYNTDASIGADL
ncbi:MAG TPA: hypothetical protein VGV18_03275, partial [Verrucomicrobiae bacterium]|nr:hypothetical protein [Verrucomicrobiae bacterium]